MLHEPTRGVLGPDAVSAGGAVRRASGVAPRVRDREGHRAEVGQPVPDLDPAGRLRPGRGALGGRAAGRPATAAPVPADRERPGQRDGGAGGTGAVDARPRGCGGPGGQAPGGGGGGVMGRFTGVLAGLLGRSAGLLPAARREWAAAVLAEAGEVPAGAGRVAWLCGGLWLVAREAVMGRVMRVLAFAAGAVGLVWIG